MCKQGVVGSHPYHPSSPNTLEKGFYQILRKFCIHGHLSLNNQSPRGLKNQLKGLWLPPILFHSLFISLRVAKWHWDDNLGILWNFCLHGYHSINNKSPRGLKNQLKGLRLPPILFHSLFTSLRVAKWHWDDNLGILWKFCLHSYHSLNNKSPRGLKNQLKGLPLPPILFHNLFTFLRVAKWHWDDNLGILWKFCLHGYHSLNNKSPRGLKNQLKGLPLPPILFHKLFTFLRVAKWHWDDNLGILWKFCLHGYHSLNNKIPRGLKNQLKGLPLPPILFHNLFTFLRVAKWHWDDNLGILWKFCLHGYHSLNNKSPRSLKNQLKGLPLPPILFHHLFTFLRVAKWHWDDNLGILWKFCLHGYHSLNNKSPRGLKNQLKGLPLPPVLFHNLFTFLRVAKWHWDDNLGILWKFCLHGYHSLNNKSPRGLKNQLKGPPLPPILFHHLFTFLRVAKWHWDDNLGILWKFCLHGYHSLNNKSPRGLKNQLKGLPLPPILFHNLFTFLRVAKWHWDDNLGILWKFCLHGYHSLNNESSRGLKNQLKGLRLPPILFHSLFTSLRVAKWHWDDNLSILWNFCLHGYPFNK